MKTLPQRKRNRLVNYNYSTNGYYFVTICVDKMKPVFGRVYSGKMKLNVFGEILLHAWHDLPNHYPNCILAEFIIMPNHFHGILQIENKCFGFSESDKKTHGLSEFIRAFKSFSSRRINQLNSDLNFKWKRSFYDHMIRNERDYLRIAEYIQNNPAKWECDQFYKAEEII